MAKQVDVPVPVVGPKSPSRRPPVETKLKNAAKAMSKPVVAKRAPVKK